MRPARSLRSMLLTLAAGLVVAISSWQAPAFAQGTQAMSWSQLSSAQKSALQPLAAQWSGIPADQQRKWVVMANNYPRMSAQDQARMQQRMANWAALSASERQQARRNFDAAREANSPKERKAKWEAYKNLDESERKALNPHKSPPPPAVPAVQMPSVKPQSPVSIKP